MMSRLWRSRYGRGVLLLSLLWLVFVVALDFRFIKLPRTPGGGLKILMAGWIVFLLLYAGFRLLRFLVGKRT